MSYNFVLQTVIVFALGAMIYLVARALPRVPAEPGADAASAERAPDFIERLIGRLPLKRLDAATGAFAEKLLRRVRLFVLKFDNWIHHSIIKVKATTEGAAKEEAAAPLTVPAAEPQPPAVIETRAQAMEKPEEPPSPPQKAS